MATYTRTELARDVLIGHRIAGAEGEIAAADREYVVRTYNNLHSEWQSEDRVYWAPDAIPGVLFESIKELVWNRVANSFGRAQTPEEQKSREVLLMKQFYRLNSRKPSGNRIKAMYY